MEEVFVNVNPSSTLKLGQARGVAILTPSLLNIPVFESYDLNKVYSFGYPEFSKDVFA